MERPTKKIILPLTGQEAEIITYFTRGERIEIERSLLSKTKMVMRDGKQELDFDPCSSIEQTEKTILIATKKIGDNQATKELIDNLPDEDGDFLEKEINKIGQDKKKQ